MSKEHTCEGSGGEDAEKDKDFNESEHNNKIKGSDGQDGRDEGQR